MRRSTSNAPYSKPASLSAPMAIRPEPGSCRRAYPSRPSPKLASTSGNMPSMIGLRPNRPSTKQGASPACSRTETSRPSIPLNPLDNSRAAVCANGSSVPSTTMPLNRLNSSRRSPGSMLRYRSQASYPYSAFAVVLFMVSPPVRSNEITVHSRSHEPEGMERQRGARGPAVSFRAFRSDHGPGR
ncbi:hypothetical protein D3C74_236460 [compost metagenome]